MAVVGIAEVLHKIPTVVSVQEGSRARPRRRRPALAILVDSPGTHLGVARRLKNAGIPVGYFIGPQIWAWRAGRIRVVKRLVKRMVVIFPFEEKIYRDAGVPVNFVGHPLVDVVRPTMTREEFAARHGLDADAADRHASARQPARRNRAAFPAGNRGVRTAVAEQQGGWRDSVRARGGARAETPNSLRRICGPGLECDASGRSHLRRARRGGLRHRGQRDGDGRGGTAGHADGRDLSRSPGNGFLPAAHDSDPVYQHGESNRGETRGAGIDAGRFHACRRRRGSSAASGIHCLRATK